MKNLYLLTTGVNYFCVITVTRERVARAVKQTESEICRSVLFLRVTWESFWGCFVDSSLCLQCKSSNVCVRVCVRLWHLFTSVSVRLSEWSALWDLTFKYKSLSSPLSLSLPLWPCVTGSASGEHSVQMIWTLTAILCLFKSLTVFLYHCIYSQPNLSQIKCCYFDYFRSEWEGRLICFSSPISTAPLTRIVILAAHFTCSHNPTAETVSGPHVGLDHRPVESSLRCFQSGCAALEREKHHPLAN